MISLEQARERILAAVRPLPVETVELPGAFGRYAAEPILSPIDLPPADNCAMDGYAVRAEDLAAASPESPVILRLLGTAPAGVIFDDPVKPGTCARVFTGSILPAGADAVVMQEDVQRDAGQSANVIFTEPISPWESVRFRGGDVKAGAPLVEAGGKLTAPRLSLLAAAGVGAVRVGQRALTGLLATGNELREAGKPLPPGTIYESNRAALAALARQAGAVPKIYPVTPDDLAATKSALEQALAECDVVVTIGGISVGGMDWVKAAFGEIGGQVDFWTVAMRPGKPFAFGRWKEKILFGLPGNPASALVTFFLLARPALLRMQGAAEVNHRTIRAALAEPLANPGERRQFARVTMDAAGDIRSAGNQSSHILSAMARSDGLVDIPPRTTLPAGMTVALIPWE
jgi:molybdopterin molybdotransferase